jgi:hypothetical protein
MLGLMLCRTLQAGKPDPNNRPQLTVCVYNFARVSDATLTRAMSQTVRMFEESGIDLLWISVEVSGEAPLRQTSVR